MTPTNNLIIHPQTLALNQKEKHLSSIESKSATETEKANEDTNGSKMVVSDGPIISAGQVAFLLGIIPIFVAWIYSEFLEYNKNSSLYKLDSDNNLLDLEKEKIKEDDQAGGLPRSASAKFHSSAIKMNLIRFLTMDESFLLENRTTLRAMSEFGAVLDRTNILRESTKNYNRDLFVFLYFLLIIKHTDKSTFTGKSTLYLNQHQTEEWKGWMQVLFLMYHYFAATEIYSAIRFLIAAYDSSIARFAQVIPLIPNHMLFHNVFPFSFLFVLNACSLVQMMWRLNFFVVFCCAVLNNDYMLYYICPMHTLYTIMVYRVLYNENSSVIAAKILSCFLMFFLIWETPGVFDILWSPLTFLLGYIDPVAWMALQTKTRSLYMNHWDDICVEKWMEKLEETKIKKKLSIKTCLVAISLYVGYLWYEIIYKLDKAKIHNWLGKITLETYILQFHIWLSGQLNWLYSVIPEYPLLNFMLTTTIYILVSHQFFELTNTLKTVFIPTKNNS
ncbi:hypothetical protein SADUNF_Sadunf11G0054600 [Salix dunnii]|uniref:Cas1p 10 TM acyl transferase domain-containing protein n=1 Tax=Salix dunnii TaxID=1413687 RepID=A0A835JJV3_9ROSI|nr:hypothetical protein SADUNF_Sadunf11G0054600 [Salix dunnii]